MGQGQQKKVSLQDQMIFANLDDFLGQYSFSKPFYKQRRFWLTLLMGGLVGAGIAVALPFIAANAVAGLVAGAVLFAGATGGWALIAVAGLLAGVLLACLGFALVKGIRAALKSNPQSAQQYAKTITEGKPAAPGKKGFTDSKVERLSAFITAGESEDAGTSYPVRHSQKRTPSPDALAKQMIKLMTVTTPVSQSQERKLRAEAVAGISQRSIADTIAYHYAALGVTPPAPGKTDTARQAALEIKEMYYKLLSRWSPEQNRNDVVTARREIIEILRIYSELTNPTSRLRTGQLWTAEELATYAKQAEKQVDAFLGVLKKFESNVNDKAQSSSQALAKGAGLLAELNEKQSDLDDLVRVPGRSEQSDEETDTDLDSNSDLSSDSSSTVDPSDCYVPIDQGESSNSRGRGFSRSGFS